MKRRTLLVSLLLGALAACGEKGVAKSSAAPGPAAPGPRIELAALKVTPTKRGKEKDVELRADGAVLIDGNMTAKIQGDHVESANGTSLLTVGANGRLVGAGVGPGFKFEGDDLVTDAGAKLSVAEDGAIRVTKDRDTETIAKVEGGSSAKRAALVLTVLWLALPMYVTTDTSKADIAPQTPASR